MLYTGRAYDQPRLFSCDTGDRSFAIFPLGEIVSCCQIHGLPANQPHAGTHGRNPWWGEDLCHIHSLQHPGENLLVSAIPLCNQVRLQLFDMIELVLHLNVTLPCALATSRIS